MVRGSVSAFARVMVGTVLLLTAFAATGSAQVIDDRLAPAGTLRLSAWPSFTAWDQRFGASGEADRVSLGQPLTSDRALELFPGASTLTEGLRELSGAPDYQPTMGGVEGRVSHDVTEIDLGIDYGITEWWTVGASVPRVKTRTAVDLVFLPDTVAGDLGISPYLTARNDVDMFLGGLRAATTAAWSRADGLCESGDPACEDATALAQRTGRFDQTLSTVFHATPFFPLEGSSIATELADRITALDSDLRDAGLDGLPGPLVLSNARATEADLETLPAQFDRLGYAEPLRTRTSLWTWGDVELKTSFGVLTLGRPLAARPGFSLEVQAGALLRLGTGRTPDPDVPLDLGSGDGQRDIEGRLAARARFGSRFSFDGGVLYGTQNQRTLERRGVVEGSALAPAASSVALVWDPGSYWAVEAEPALRLADALTVGGVYRYFSRGADAFSAVADSPSGTDDRSWTLPSGDPARRHQMGLTLVYDTATPTGAEGSRPLRLRLRWLHAVAGHGADMPVTNRIEAGAEIYAPLWPDH
ncbi:MAG: hypothetical protein U5R14_06760 [Gemmatimonadota bacterium]|nr:hypothetical protein [Gemmatimonadota bacterium]